MYTFESIQKEALQKWVGKKVYFWNETGIYCGTITGVDPHQFFVGKQFATKGPIFLELEALLTYLGNNVMGVES